MEALLLTTRSAAQRAALERARRFAEHDENLLIEGETGTGKSNLARFIHEVSPRRQGKLVEYTIAGSTDELILSDLFGHQRGAFTGASSDRVGHARRARGGTLFLDEIGKATPFVQQRLLDFTETRQLRSVGSDKRVEVDCRLVCASNVPLAELVARDEFLPDLHHRLAILQLRLPALRERREDIPDIVAWLVEERVRNARVLATVPALHSDFIALCTADRWPGNIRELNALITRVVLLNAGAAELTPNHFLAERPAPVAAKAATETPLREHLLARIAEHDGNMTRAAEALGMHRSTLYRKLEAAAGI